jgi:ABC-2 type transport system permease protein
MWCSGVFLANFLAWSRISVTFVEYLEMPIAIICGFMFPIRVLPNWMQTVSGAFPIRWALEAMNESLLGMSDLTYLGTHWLITIALSLLILVITNWLQAKVEDKIRVSGELSSI